MADRFNKVFGIFGARGTGKTDYAKGNPKHNLPGLINAYVKSGMKVFVIDTFDHPSWRDLPAIGREDFPNFKKGACRVITPAADIPRLNTYLNTQHKHVRNCLLLYEDARKHTQTRVDKSLIELIGDSKQKNIDIGFMYHAFAFAPLDLYR